MVNSPPDKQFPSQRGFPTPNSPPETVGCRIFSVPSDEEWFALYMHVDGSPQTIYITAEEMQRLIALLTVVSLNHIKDERH